jgi:hypothetical protein
MSSASEPVCVILISPFITLNKKKKKMDLFLQPEDISSPPSTPPYRPLQRQRSSYIVDSGGNSDSISDKVRLDYMSKVKSTFQHLNFQQRHLFLTEILGCCDNQLLQYIYTLHQN